MKVEIDLRGRPAKRKYWDHASVKAKVAMGGVLKEIAVSLQSDIQENLGPYKDTGAMIDAVKVRESETGYEVVSSDPGQWRLEMGFVGLDSAGRNYDQGPRPAWRPAIQKTKAEVPPRLRKIIKDALL